MITVHPAGQNGKLGKGVATTYRPVGLTCPPSCPLLGNGCYAQRGRVFIQSRRAKHRDDELLRLAGNTLVRHLVSGDWLKPTKDGRRIVDRSLLRGVIELHRAAKWLVGWGYTHAADRLARGGFGPESWPSNFRILASCDTAEQKARYNAEGWQTARVIEDKSDRLPDELLCPVDAGKRAGLPVSERTTCARCRACFDTNQNIAFLRS